LSEADWYWGVVVRVDASHEVLQDLGTLVDGEGVRAQDPATGHITLFYAPLRGPAAAPELAERVRGNVGHIDAFDLHCAGFGEFPSATRPVAWLGIVHGQDVLARLREVLCDCDEDCHRHAFVPHLTLAYGEDPAAYAATRAVMREVAEHAAIATRIDAVWIAGFPADGHPARDLRYVERIPLAGG
jgi:2'-5' RNA ligase